MSVLDAAFEEAIAGIQGLAEKFDQSWTDLVTAVGVVVPLLPAYLQPVAKGRFDKLAAKKDNALEKFWKVFTERGDASAVRQVASGWNTRVGAVVSNQADKLTPSQLPSHNRWEGPASVAYKEVANFQSGKLGEVKTMVTALQGTLNEIADAMNTFWTGMRTTYAAYIVAMGVCAFGARTPAGLVPAILAGIGATALFFEQIDKLSTEFVNALDTKEAALEAQQTLNGTDGKWPLINTGALDDASVLDDDQKSDWTARA